MYNMKNLILTLSFLSLSGVSAQSATMDNNILGKPYLAASLDLEYEINNEKFHRRFEPLPFTKEVVRQPVNIPENSVIKKATWFIQDNTEVKCDLASEGVKLADIENFLVYRSGYDGGEKWMTCKIFYSYK